MRINPANIPAQVNAYSAGINPQPTDKAYLRRQEIEARDEYRNNAGSVAPQIIDAEYVEFYSPSPVSSDREHQVLDSTLEPEITRLETSSPENTSLRLPSLTKYQLKSSDVAPPGSYIDIFV